MPVAASMVLGIAGIVLSLPAWFYFLRGAARLYRFIASGAPDLGALSRTSRPSRRVLTLLKETFFHTELMRKPVVAVAHWFVMVGFLIGSMVWFEAYIQTFDPAGGWPIIHKWLLYHFADEVLGLGTVVGICTLIIIRFAVGSDNRVDRFYGSNARAAHFVEGVVLLEGIGMMLVKAGKIATFDTHPHLWSDFLTMHVAKLLPASPVLVSVFALLKLLTGMVWLFVVGNQLHWGVAWHRFLAFFNIFFQRNPDGAPALGKIPTIDLEQSVGVGTTADAPWKMLLDAATCTECGRCQEQCPAWNTAKPLSPKKLITDIRDASLDAYAGVDVLKLVGTAVEPDELWSCTNCGACVEQCPVDIEHIDHVANLRRFQVLAESDFPSELTGLFKNLESKGNPWGRNDSERTTWIDDARRDGLTIPIFGEDITDFSDTEYLFWVGCAGTFDDDAKKTTRAIVELLETAGVKYCVLAKGETCTGDPARRAGNEFLFQMLATENVAQLNTLFDGVPTGQRKIITSCAHCFNTLRNEYPDFDGHFDVFHHTQLLNRLVRDGLLKPVPRPASARKPITYHDPCFLGRHNKIFDPPRELIESTGAQLLEMGRTRNEGFCCGAGGARMFMEENLGTRISENRATEAIETGAEEIAVGCPFCNSMLVSGTKAVAEGAVAERPAPKVRDVAQMLRDAVLINDQLPAPRTPTFLEPPKRITPRQDEKEGTPPTPAPTPAAEAKPAAPTPTSAASPPKTPAGGGVPQAPGGVPGAPGVPSAPSSPSAPGVPSVPKAPGVPTPPAPGGSSGVPSAPGAPSAPSSPSVPGVPKAPGAPGAPAAPGAPKPPANSGIPQTPGGVPGVPGVPSAPSSPSVPGAPGVPKAPGVPTPPAPGGTSGVPSAPGAPSSPSVPGVPKAPGTPKPPATSGIPQAPGGVPGVPSVPGAPKPPGVPSTPSIPKAPDSPAPPAPSTSVPKAPNTPKPPTSGTVPPPPGPSTTEPGDTDDEDETS